MCLTRIGFFGDCGRLGFLSRASLGHSAERALLGGGADTASCLTPERMIVERRGKRQKKLLTRRLGTPKFCLKRSEVRSGSGQGSKLQVSTLLVSEPNWRSATPRTRPEVSAVLKTLCKGQGQGQVRSPK